MQFLDSSFLPLSSLALLLDYASGVVVAIAVAIRGKENGTAVAGDMVVITETYVVMYVVERIATAVANETTDDQVRLVVASTMAIRPDSLVNVATIAAVHVR